ncbi:hypothetical protein BC835DRAFT_1420882 [Cytidiella melzeri]|nr:hypothetical protein BC835DRAFT_1420882 [Cytidiella melzeri]
MQLSAPIVLLAVIATSTVHLVTVSAAPYSSKEPRYPVHDNYLNGWQRRSTPYKWTLPALQKGYDNIVYSQTFWYDKLCKTGEEYHKNTALAKEMSDKAMLNSGQAAEAAKKAAAEKAAAAYNLLATDAWAKWKDAQIWYTHFTSQRESYLQEHPEVDPKEAEYFRNLKEKKGKQEQKMLEEERKNM